MSKIVNEVAQFIRNWNLKYPIDRWYRDKYNIPFGSEQHRSSSIVSMRIDFEEDLLYRREIEKEKLRKLYKPGKWLNPYIEAELSQDKIVEQYEELDIDNMILEKPNEQ